MTDSGKHSSLLGYGKNYCYNFYSTNPWGYILIGHLHHLIVFLDTVETLSSAQCYKTFNVCNLQMLISSESVLFLAGIYSLVQCLLVRPRAYPGVEYLRGSSLG